MSRTTSHTQRSRQPPPTAKQASEEQLHIAGRIGESHTIPSDIKIKIQQVAAIVPDKSEDEICIVLHDNNFDPEATISALLDTDSGDVKNEWTTKKSKSKKKVTQPAAGKVPSADTIIAPGDSHSFSDREGTRSYGGTSKAASKSTRENYGGSVSVERVDREQRSSKSYGRNTSRGFRDRGSSGDRGRLQRRRGGGFRGFSSRDHDRGRSGGGGSENISNHLSSSQSNVPSTEAAWDDETTFSSTQNDDPLLSTSSSAEANWGQNEHPGITSAPGIPSSEQVSSAPSLSVFPDAMVPPLATEGEEIQVSNSSPLINTTIPPSQQQTAVLDNRLLQQLMAQEMSAAIPASSSSQLKVVKFSDDLPTSQSSSQKLKSSKMRKAMRSEIPSDPVQMPRAMGSLEAQFGNLGIDFIGMNGGGGVNEADNIHSMTQTMAQQQQQVESDMTATSFPQHLGQLHGGSVDQLTHTTTSNNPLLDSVTADVYTTQQHFVDDPSIISIASSSIMGTGNSRQGFHHEEAPAPKIEPPPGLTHPSKLQQQANKDAVAKANELLQAPISLSTSQQSEPRTSSYGQTSSETSTIVLSQQDSLLSTMAAHQPPPLGTAVGGHKRNSSLQAEHHETLSTESSSVLSGRSHDLNPHPQDHPILGKTSSGPPALDMARVGSGNMPSSLPPSSRIDSLSSSREPSSSQMELPVSRIEPPPVSQSVFSNKGMGQVSNGLLMTPMTTAAVTCTPMTAVSMGYSNVGGTGRSGVSHSGPQSKHAVPPGMMYPAAAMVPQYPFVAYFPPSSDSMMGTGMMRDHTTSNYPPADAKYGREISSPVGSTHGQQGQQAAQAQQQGLQQNQGVHPFMNAAAIPYGNMFYANSAMLPSLYPTLGLPGFSPSMPPKPGAAGGSYPTGAVSSYQSMGAASGFNMSGGYDEMNATVNHDYKYMNPQTGKLPVGGSAVASTNSDMGGSSFKHQQPPFDTTKNYGYNMPMGGSAGGYMGGFFPTMAMHPAAVPSLIPTPTDVNQPRQPVQKQHKPYMGSVF